MRKILFILMIYLGLGIHVDAQSSSFDTTSIIKRFEYAKDLIEQRKYKTAEKILNNLLKNPQFKNLNCKLQSNIYNQTGVVYYYQNKIIKAFDIWKEHTLPLLNSCDSTDMVLKAQTMYNIGYCYMKFNNYDKAISFKEHAFNLIDSLGLLYKDSKYAYWSDNLFFSYNKIGDFNKAEGYAFRTLTILDSLSYPDTQYIASIYRKIGINFIEKNKSSLAKQYLDISHTLLNKQDETKLLYLYLNYAMYYYRVIGDFVEAKKWMQLAWNLYNKTKDDKQLRLLQETEGLISISMNKNEEALYCFMKSLNILKKLNANKSTFSNIYENIAGSYARMGKLDSALYYIDKSIYTLHALSELPELEKYKELMKNDFSKRDMIRKLQMKAKFFSERYNKSKDIADLLRSEETFATADTLVYQLRKEIKNKDSKIIIGIALDTVYSYALGNVYKLWELTGDKKYLKRAYYYSSENKAVVFTETKEELNAVWNILPSKLRNRYLYLTDEIKSNLYQRQYAVLKNDTISYRKLNSKYISLSSEKEKLLEKIKLYYPRFYQNIEGSLKPKTINQLQSELDEDNAVIEYYVDRNILYSFVITKNHFDGIKQNFNYNLDTTFKVFNKQLSNFYNKSGFVKLAKQLYPVLFPDKIKNDLEEKKISRLVIIRDKNMNLMPFGPLLTGNDSIKDLLIHKYSFSYLYNNKYLCNNYKVESAKEFEFGGFATNYDEKTLEDISHDSIYWKESGPPVLSPLKLSIEEIEEIAKLFKSEKWLGEECTVENFKENACKYDIIHLSLHSIISSDNNEQSAMIFQKTSNNRTYILKSSDIIGLHLNNSLSVLSSCFTSKGDVISGEGMKSLARNFAIAGSPTIVASQWQAYEGQTKYILNLFYKNLRKGFPKDVAMQKAKLKYIKEAGSQFTAPANWANLIVIGETNPVEFIFWHHLTAFDIFIYIVLLLLVIFLVRKIFYGKKRG